MSEDVRIIEGDAVAMMRTLADGSVDAIVTDPPYPEIDRPYGRMSEADWHAMMRAVVAECRRVLTPTGSAVFILQPNSERVGRMRPWLWEFMAWTAREWGQVQDAWWWNTATLPVGGANIGGLMRPSLKACVWLGSADCYRDQDSVLLTESESNRRDRAMENFPVQDNPSRRRSRTEGPRDDSRRMRTACVERGGTTPFNVLPFGSDGRWSGGTHGHGASTPLSLCDWWIRYISRPRDLILDPFCGSGTIPLAAFERDRRAIGIDKESSYCLTSRTRLADAASPMFDPPATPTLAPDLFSTLTEPPG